jgi:hypothetical protein
MEAVSRRIYALPPCRWPVMAAGSTMRSKSAAPMYPEASALPHDLINQRRQAILPAIVSRAAGFP